MDRAVREAEVLRATTKMVVNFLQKKNCTLAASVPPQCQIQATRLGPHHLLKIVMNVITKGGFDDVISTFISGYPGYGSAKVTEIGEYLKMFQSNIYCPFCCHSAKVVVFFFFPPS